MFHRQTSLYYQCCTLALNNRLNLFRNRVSILQYISVSEVCNINDGFSLRFLTNTFTFYTSVVACLHLLTFVCAHLFFYFFSTFIFIDKFFFSFNNFLFI